MRHLFRKVTAVIAAAAALILITASAAFAAYTEQRVYNSAGTLKALGFYDTGTNRLCVRAYNSVSGVFTNAFLETASGGTRYAEVQDEGGDSNNTCITVSPDYGPPTVLGVCWRGTGGDRFCDRMYLN